MKFFCWQLWGRRRSLSSWVGASRTLSWRRESRQQRHQSVTLSIERLPSSVSRWRHIHVPCMMIVYLSMALFHGFTRPETRQPHQLFLFTYHILTDTLNTCCHLSSNFLAYQTVYHNICSKIIHSVVARIEMVLCLYCLADIRVFCWHVWNVHDFTLITLITSLFLATQLSYPTHGLIQQYERCSV
jgi:hypothetical protein